MKKFWYHFYYSFPIQLLLLHFRKSQVLLVWWLILFMTISGRFMESFGANALFLAPEYLGNVNAAGAAIVGVCTGIFIMSWNITTFILHSMRFRFLASSSKPFLKYCLNNSIIPLAFLLLYFSQALYFDITKELIPLSQFFLIVLGFLGGLFLLLLVSFIYFFGADRRIIRTFKPGFVDFDENKSADPERSAQEQAFGLPVKFYLNTRFRFSKVRPVGHYSQSFLDLIFKRHHFSAMVTILLAFIFMIFLAFFLDHPVFQIPAAASILIFFAILIAVMGALSYFLRSWSLLFVIFLYAVFNTLYQYNIIDPRNKAYGLDYAKPRRPAYTLEKLASLATPDKVAADKKNMLAILEKWKARQEEGKPLMIFLNFSGGGVRSACFAMNALQQLDSLSGGQLMKKTVLMTGASGGMLAAAYFRELARLKYYGASIDLRNKEYIDDISEDLLNPVFSSLIARDLISPSQKFTYIRYRYVKDRGYAFEEKLNRNTGYVLDKPLGFYRKAEGAAQIPMMILASTVTRDFKRMMVSPQPLSFMMQPLSSDSATKMSGPDAIDFGALFKERDPMNLRMLTALRMNATYPYVLPSVWLPSDPVIDVMDAGLSDNVGTVMTLRFLEAFKDWVKENTRGVLIIQMRSHTKGSWEGPYKDGGISGIITNPFTMLQTNWFRLQDYSQDDEYAYIKNVFGDSLQRVSLMYIPHAPDKEAPINFHLTTREKIEVSASLRSGYNLQAFGQIRDILKAE